MDKEISQPIRQDFLEGMSLAAIARKYSIDPRTAKRYALNNLPLEELYERPFKSILDPYKSQIDSWLLNGYIFSRTIHDRLIEYGCKCGYTIVNDYVRQKILEYEISGMAELSKEYYYFQALEDISRITIFVNQTLHTLYRFIGEERYTTFINKFNTRRDFFLNCDLELLNNILVEYGENEYENDDPNHLFSTLFSFFK